MDATRSMTHLLEKCKYTVGEMFTRAKKILEDAKLNISFEMQLVVYRNYSSGKDLILQCSGWESKPPALRAFMDSISPSGGQGNEAIEIGLWHANQEFENGSGVTQIILIGDAPANTVADVKSKRKGAEAYWYNTKFSKPTIWTTELASLKSKNVPVHTFYVAWDAKHNFDEIASQTNGKSYSLNINGDEGAAMLTNVVTEAILKDAGGDIGDKLVEMYRKTYKQ